MRKGIIISVVVVGTLILTMTFVRKQVVQVTPMATVENDHHARPEPASGDVALDTTGVAPALISDQEVGVQDAGQVLSPVDDYALARVMPEVERRYFSAGKPIGYLRHQIVEVDTQLFRRRAEASLRTSSTDGIDLGIPIQYFKDVSFNVVVESLEQGEFGGEFFRGRISDEPAGSKSFSFDIGTDGTAYISMETAKYNYLVESIAEQAYYIVFEFDNSIDIPFD